MPPPLTWTRLLTAWQLTPGAVAAVLLAAGYLWAARRSGPAWPGGRTASFLVGMAWLLLVTGGWVGVYDATLFWVRAARDVSLLMVVPMLAAAGAPLTLLRDVLPAGARARAGRVLRAGWARRLTFPLVITVVFLAPLPLLYLTPLYPASLAHPLVDGLVRLGLLGAGWLYFWTRFRVDPTPRADPYLVSLGISVGEVVVDGALGLVVWLGPLLAPAHWLGLHRGWGPDVRLDQIIGAGVLWIGGDLAGLPFLGVVMRRMTREDAEQAALIDAELDAAELDAAEPAPSPAGTAPAAPPRLWWEDHPELAERFRRR